MILELGPHSFHFALPQPPGPSMIEFPRTTEEIIRQCKAKAPNPPLVVEKELVASVHGGRVRTAPQVPLVVTAVLLCAILPLWMLTVIPLSLFYRISSFLWTASRQAFRPAAGAAAFTSTKDPHHPELALPLNSTPRSARKYDVVLLGATGFTGRLALRHLIKSYHLKDSSERISWAIAGRSPSKLQQALRDAARELGIISHEKLLQLEQRVDLLVVDTVQAVPDQMMALVSQTRVVATTVGPYVTSGNAVVEYCARYGTHYCDITGEVDWIQMMKKQHGEIAKQTGSKLVPFCGHDSIPWDLSVLMMQHALQQELGSVGTDDDSCLGSATFYNMSDGEAPPGTLATLLTYAKGGGPAVDKTNGGDDSSGPHRVHSDLPMFIAPLSSSSLPWQRGQQTSHWLYTIPYIMAPVNAEVVKWSYASCGRNSGAACEYPHQTMIYREFHVMPNLVTALGTYIIVYLLFGSMTMNPVTLYILEHYLIPRLVQGPKLDDMLNKYFLFVLGRGVSRSGKVEVNSVCYFDKDCGCLETSRMLIESAVCLALEARNPQNDQSLQGGFYSPSNGIGLALLDRLLATDPAMFFTMSVVPSQEA
jgi:short subunit dehydrogenase-like uncharacterized protein